MTDTPLAAALDALTAAVTRLAERSDELAVLPAFSGPGKAAELVGILDDGVADVRTLASSLPGGLDGATDQDALRELVGALEDASMRLAFLLSLRSAPSALDELLPAVAAPLCELHRGLALRYRALTAGEAVQA